MSTAIAGVEHRTTEVEVVTMWIASINAEVPETITPVEWTIEIGSCAECLPLPIQQNIAQVQVTTLPVVAIDIVITRHTHQVVEVDFIGSLILLVRQVQLVSHLVCQEQSLVACLFVAHCLARCCYRQHCYQGYHHLLHITFILIVLLLISYHDAKVGRK
jgi:hypothetical protein